jgi:hypothetical protein
VTVCLSFPILCGTNFISGVLLLPVLLFGFPSRDPLPWFFPDRPDDDRPLPPAQYVTSRPLFKISISDSITYGLSIDNVGGIAVLQSRRNLLRILSPNECSSYTLHWLWFAFQGLLLWLSTLIQSTIK